MREALLTTIDNPFNPFTEFDTWKRFDEDMGYYSLNYLARISTASLDMSDEDYCQAVNDAVDEIVKFNINGMYRKIYKDGKYY